MNIFQQFKFPSSVRPAQYAGTWYEADGKKLASQLGGFIDSAHNDPVVADAINSANKSELLAIIAPHAGYLYSGKTAAYGYDAAAAVPNVQRVFVLGPSHHVALQGVGLPSATSFETPLGSLSVDKELVEELKDYPLFSVEPEVHRVEHSLELQLPFVRKAFGDVKIVPLVVGALHGESEVRAVAEVLKGFVRKGDLVVVSSDFTHYGPRYGYTPFAKYSRTDIEKLDREACTHLANKDLSGFIDFHNRTEDTICGLFPCAVLCALLPPHAQGHLLKYATSQDVVPDDADNSVSYLSIVFTGDQWPADPSKQTQASEIIRLSDSERETLLSIARNSLYDWVNHKRAYDPAKDPAIQLTPHLKESFGAFVTLYTKLGPAQAGQPQPGTPKRIAENKDLRGCIGNILPVRPLYQTVVENAIAAATKDPRFLPVTSEELSKLEIEISVLTPPRRVKSFEEIVIGRDGIILAKNGRQSVFLPQVATEFGWDRDETLTQLSIKAGLGPDDWRQGAKFDVFQSISVEEHH